jgi:hypothetical protein
MIKYLMLFGCLTSGLTLLTSLSAGNWLLALVCLVGLVGCALGYEHLGAKA